MTLKEHLEAVRHKLHKAYLPFLCCLSDGLHDPVNHAKIYFFFKERKIGGDGLNSWLAFHLLGDEALWRQFRAIEGQDRASRFSFYFRKRWLDQAIELQDTKPGILPELPTPDTVRAMWAAWEPE